jgi:hypothetical protein
VAGTIRGKDGSYVLSVGGLCLCTWGLGWILDGSCRQWFVLVAVVVVENFIVLV